MFFDIQQERTHFLERLDDLKVSSQIAGIFADFFAGSSQSVASLFYEMIDDVEVVDILLREKPVSLFVLMRPDDLELLLPITNKRSVDIKHPGHFANAVIDFPGLAFL